MAGDELVPRPARGRVFSGSVRVRLADLSRTGRLRLDAIARFAQDVASDDAADAGQRPDRAWVVRRLVLELHDDRVARLRDDLTLDTWCSGVGPRWAERRTDIRLGSTVVARAAAVWVLIDVATGRPVPLGDDFDRVFAQAAGGRRVGQRLRHAAPGREADRARWPLRVTDFDLLGHVNNTAYWAAAEDALAALDPRRGARRAGIEFRSGVDPGEPVELLQRAGADELQIWFTVAGEVRASIVLDLAAGAAAARRF